MIASIRYLAVALLALTGVTAAPAPARAETFHTCAGFIDTLPATIATQGVWCLRKDLSTAITSGNAITIATNNVTIDCNYFKLGGLQAGDSSSAFGIRAENRLNATVRHCNVRGFFYGIYLDGGGHMLEDNRLDQNLFIGIRVDGDNNTVRRNAVYDTGGLLGSDGGYGIYGSADVIDNTVSGVFAPAANTYPQGISAFGAGTEVRGNRVRGLLVSGSGYAFGIRARNVGITIDGNRISATALTTGWGISGNGITDTFCSDNTVARFSTTITSCQDIGGNASN